jgi:hypothetical protein
VLTVTAVIRTCRHPDVPSCEVLTVAAVVQTCCEAATAAQDGVNGW